MALVLALLASRAAPALAADDTARAAARRLATAGVEAYQRDDYNVAVEKLEKAYEMLRVPSVGLWLARALVKQGKLVAASERYTEVGRLSTTSGDVEVQNKAKQDAATELEALNPQIPNVVIRVEGAETSQLKLKLDGKEISSAVVGEQQPVDPGKHHIEAALGEQTQATDVTVARAETKTATLRFAGATTPAAAAASHTPAAAPEPTSAAPASSSKAGSTRTVVAWATLGVGAAGLIVGGVTGGMAMSKKSDLEASPDCADHTCFRGTMEGDVNSYQTLRTVSTIGFIGGGVLAATGVVLLLTRPKTDSTASHELWLRVGANGATAGGRF
jgi:hypothetical protein